MAVPLELELDLDASFLLSNLRFLVFLWNFSAIFGIYCKFITSPGMWCTIDGLMDSVVWFTPSMFYEGSKEFYEME